MLHYIEQGSGETIVLLHGFAGSSSYWEKVIPTLAQNYRVIAPDLSGHGRSSAPEGSMLIEDYATEILELIDHLNIDKILLLGHSMGGYIALAFAEKYPDRLKAFGLIHSTAYPDDEKAKAGREKSIQMIQDQGLETFIKQLIPKLFAPDNLETLHESVQEAEKIGFSMMPISAITALEAMKARIDRNHVLQESKLPILLVAGEKDLLIPPEKTFVVEGTHVTQLLIPDVGHMSMYESPMKLMDAITKFANTILKVT